LQIKIPPSNCILHTDVLIPIGVPVVNGSSKIRIPVPTPVPTGLFRVQYLINGSGAWQTSNAVTIRLP